MHCTHPCLPLCSMTPLFCAQLFCCSDLSSRKVPLKVLEVGLRSSGLVPAADTVLWLLYEPVFKGTAFSHQFFSFLAYSKCAGRYTPPKQHLSLITSVTELMVQVVFLKSWLMCYICALLDKLPARETSRVSKGAEVMKCLDQIQRLFKWYRLSHK